MTNLQLESTYRMQLVKGSHIIVPQLYAGNHAYLLQHDDGRVIFTIPYHFNTTLIGTTDIAIDTSADYVAISEAEKEYLCCAVNKYFKNHITPHDILHTYCGVRPLLKDNSDNPSEITRDYKIELDQNAAPLLTIFGGKITTYRKLAENALNLLHKYFSHMKPSVTAITPLPGAQFENHSFQQFQQAFTQQYPWLDESLKQRFIHTYGALSLQILQHCKQKDDLGTHFGADLYAREVDYLRSNEWANSVEDIIWRRSKLGLVLTQQQKDLLNQYFHNFHY